MQSKFLRILKYLVIISVIMNVIFIYMYIHDEIILDNILSENKEILYAKNENLTEKLQNTVSENSSILNDIYYYNLNNKSKKSVQIMMIQREGLPSKLCIDMFPNDEEYCHKVNDFISRLFDEVQYNLKATDVKYTIYKCDLQYLSVKANYSQIAEHTASFNMLSYKTIDMKNIKEVRLEDLMILDEELVNSLIKNNILKEAKENKALFDEKNSYEDALNKNLVNDKKAILENLKKCNEPYGEPHNKKPTFYLSDGRLYFEGVIFPYHIDNFTTSVYVELDDIEDKLKVDKW